MLSEAAYYLRMANSIREITAPGEGDPLAPIRHQLANREEIFLDTLRQTVFSDSGSLYSQLFRAARCTAEDFERAVRRDGLEAALEMIRRAGVWVSHDEFKGKQPLLRDGVEIPCDPTHFLNPLARGTIAGASSGSRSKGTLTFRSRSHEYYRDGHMTLLRDEFGMNAKTMVLVRDILPSPTGLIIAVSYQRTAKPAKRWFTISGTASSSLHYRVATWVMVAVAKASGASVPWPEELPANDYRPAAKALAELKRRGKEPILSTSVSQAVRVMAAALEAGYNVAGTVVHCGGEEVTEAKRKVIAAAGARIYPSYWIHEVGFVGHACSQMNDGNRVHLFADGTAVISARRKAPLSGLEVDSFHFTTLLPHAPRVMINVEMDDSGVMKKATCNCSLSQFGFKTEISNIYSFGKLTGHGVTLVGTDILRILEERLPQRFGGAPGDFQLVEQEDSNQTVVTLRIHPRLKVTDTKAVGDAFLAEVRRCVGGANASWIWKHSGSVRAVVGVPYSTRTGKTHALHLLHGPAAERSSAT
jgi:hypothetical protein